MSDGQHLEIDSAHVRVEFPRAYNSGFDASKSLDVSHHRGRRAEPRNTLLVQPKAQDDNQQPKIAVCTQSKP